METLCEGGELKMKKITILIIVIALSLQFLNASSASNGLCWSEEIFIENYRPAIFTCKALNTTAINEEKKDESGRIYTENKGYRITVQVEKVFFGEVDTGIVNIGNGIAMKPEKTYLIYARVNLQDDYFYLPGCDYRVDADQSKEITTVKNRELEILSELSNIINNKLTCKYVMLGANNHKLAEGFFKKGKRVKKWKHYWPNSGKIKAEYDFTKNSVIQYDENGFKSNKKITSENEDIYYQYAANSKNRLAYKSITTKKDYGKLENWFRYYDNGKLQEQYSAKNLGNDKEGYGTDVDINYEIYYETGMLKAKGEFFNNDSVGTWYFYDKEGEYKEKKIYKEKFAFHSGANNYFAQEEYCTLTGKITDEENKKVIGAKVSLKQNGIEKDSCWAWNSIGMRVYSSGTYEVGVYYLGVLCKTEIIEIKTGEDITLDIQVDLSYFKRQSINGKITDKKTGENLVGARVDISNDKGAFMQNDKVYIRTETLKDGTYNIKAIPTGIYTVGIRCEGGYIFENKEIEVKKDEKINLDFQLTPISETNFYGKITVENTDNVYWGGISLIQNEKEIMKARSSMLDGTFYIKDTIPAGIYDVLVWSEGCKAERIKNIEIIPDSTYVLNVQLKGAPSWMSRSGLPSHCYELISYVAQEDLEISEYISGKITNNIGEEIKYDACIELIKNEEIIRRVDTDMNGVYKIEHVREGIYEIQISHARNETALLKGIEVKKGENVIQDIVLERKY